MLLPEKPRLPSRLDDAGMISPIPKLWSLIPERGIMSMDLLAFKAPRFGERLRRRPERGADPLRGEVASVEVVLVDTVR